VGRSEAATVTLVARVFHNSTRALAVAHTSMYDAWAAYDRVAVGTRLAGALREPPGKRTLRNKRAAISFAAYRAAADLFPASTHGSSTH
jgi:hypothetical protein